MDDDAAPTRGEDTPMRGEDTPMRGEDTPMRGEDTPMRGEDIAMRGEDTSMRGEDTPVKGGARPAIAGDACEIDNPRVGIGGRGRFSVRASVSISGGGVASALDDGDNDDPAVNSAADHEVRAVDDRDFGLDALDFDDDNDDLARANDFSGVAGGVIDGGGVDSL